MLRGNRVMSIDLSGRSILIVEDEPLIAMDVAETFKAAGANVLIAATLPDGLRLAEHPALSAAILDIALGEQDSAALCARLTQRGVPFIVYSGYDTVPAGCAPMAIVKKPAVAAALLRAVLHVVA
jgi:CheY-like chemotaxis protein